MNGKIIAMIVVAIIAIAGAGVALMMNNGGGSQNGSQTTDGITVHYIVDDATAEYAASGSTVKEALSNAMPQIVLNSAGQITDVKGTALKTGEYWTVWMWSSAYGWDMVDKTGSVKTYSGMDIALIKSTLVTGSDGNVTYTSPSFDITGPIYFFIEFREQYDKGSYTTSFLTESERRAGVWMKGVGSNAADALQSIADERGWDSDHCDISTSTYNFGWLNTLFGLSDEKHLDGTYTYWSQYQWNGDEWVYNQTTLGKLETTQYPYVALIRQTTTVDGDDAGISVTPSDIPASLLV